MLNKNFTISESELSNFPISEIKDESLIIAFGPQSTFFEKLSQEFKKLNKNIHIVGLGVNQSFVNNQTITDKISFSVLEFEKTKIKSFCLKNEGYDSSFDTGRSLLSKLKEQESTQGKLSGVLIFSEGINVNGAALVRAFEEEKIPVCGGLASEVNLAFKETKIFFDEKELANHISVVGFYGNNIEIKSLNSTGIKIIGLEKKITKSAKNKLFEIEGVPALDWYRSFLKEKGNSSANALAYPISIFKNSEAVGAIRTPIGFDEEEKSISFTGEIPEGYGLKLMIANPFQLIDKAEELVKKNSNNNFSIYLSCVARKMFLEDLTPLEYQEAKNCIGAYVYGEISLLEGKPYFLNQTFTLINIKEVA